jgi:hypothetical protein
MHRRLLITLLAFGTLAGYASGFASLHRWHRYGGHCRASEYNSRPDTAPWAPSQAPRPADTVPAPQDPQVQAQAPTTGPR